MENLRNIRKAQGLTQVDLSQRVGLNRCYLSQIETGAKKNPSLTTVSRLADALGCTLDDLLGRAQRQ